MKSPVTCLFVFLASALSAYAQAPTLQTAGSRVQAGGNSPIQEIAPNRSVPDARVYAQVFLLLAVGAAELQE
jgi:hypothetical protein